MPPLNICCSPYVAQDVVNMAMFGATHGNLVTWHFVSVIEDLRILFIHRIRQWHSFRVQTISKAICYTYDIVRGHKVRKHCDKALATNNAISVG